MCGSSCVIHWCCCWDWDWDWGFVSLLSWPLSHFLSAVPRTWWPKVAITQPSITTSRILPPSPIYPFAGLFNRWCQPALALFIFFLSWLTRASSSYIGRRMNSKSLRPPQPTPPALNKTYMCVYCIYIVSLSLFPMHWRLSAASSEVFLFDQVCRQTLSGKEKLRDCPYAAAAGYPEQQLGRYTYGREEKN